MADPWSLALEAFRCGEVAQAYARCSALLDDEPHHFGALNLMGTIALSLAQPAEALVFLDQALKVIPDQASALINRGTALHRLGRFDEALDAYRQVIVRDPASADAWFNLSTTLTKLARMDEAEEALRRCIEADEGYYAAHFNLANTLYNMKRFEESLECFDRSLSLQPTDGEARKNRAFARLMLGDYGGGWDDYEWRWKTAPLDQAWRDRGSPQWDGRESLLHKTILVHAEQGLGDTLQFCRLLRHVKAEGAAQVVFEVQAPLLSLMREIEGADIVVPQGLPLPSYDFHIPLMSLPGALGLTPQNIPSPVPYLRADATRVARWAPELPPSTFNIGICWQGSAKGSEVGKGIPLKAFEPLLAVPRVQLFSLQKQAGEDDWRSLPSQWAIHSFGPSFDTEVPFADTAAVMMGLDLVVTTDTSVAHLAGALGVPVWVALPYLCDWRWGPQAGDTPWYPTMKLFRQASPGHWGACFESMAQALQHGRRESAG